MRWDERGELAGYAAQVAALSAAALALLHPVAFARAFGHAVSLGADVVVEALNLVLVPPKLQAPSTTAARARRSRVFRRLGGPETRAPAFVPLRPWNRPRASAGSSLAERVAVPRAPTLAAKSALGLKTRGDARSAHGTPRRGSRPCGLSDRERDRSLTAFCRISPGFAANFRHIFSTPDRHR